MSSIADELRARAADRQRKHEHPLNDEQKLKHAEAQARYRQRQRVEKSLLEDEVALARGQAQRAAKRLSAAQSSTTAASSDDDKSAEDEVSDEEDDFDEAPADDDDEEDGEWTAQRVQLVYDRCTVNDRFMTSEIGVGVAMFNELFQLVREQLERTRYDGGQRTQVHVRAQRLSDTLQFFVYLRWLRQYRTYRQMAHDMDLPKKYIVKIVYRCGVALNAVAHKTPHEAGGLAKPTPAQLAAIRERCKGIAQYGLEDYAIIVDGIIVRTQAPPVELRDKLKGTLYNKHYRHWGYTVLVMCDLRGMAVWTSPALQCDEQTGAKDEEIAVWLSQTHELLGVDVGILTDSLYSFNLVDQPPAERILHQWSLGPGTLKACKALVGADSKAPKQIKADAMQALFTTRYVAMVRVPVENRNGRMRLWGPLTQGAVLRSRLFSPKGIGKYMLTPTNIVENVAFIVNRQLLIKPLRAANWRPAPLQWRGQSPPDGFKCFYPNFGHKTEMVNRSRMQKRLPAIARMYVPSYSKSKKAEDDDDDDEDDDLIEEKGDYVYLKPKSTVKVQLTRRQAARLERSAKPEHYFAADESGLQAAEATKRGRRK